MSVNTAFETSDLPKAEFMFPGPERDRLVKLILDGVKTATAALMIEYEEEVEPAAVRWRAFGVGGFR